MYLDINRRKDIGVQIFLMGDFNDFVIDAYFSLIKPVVNQETYCGTSFQYRAITTGNNKKGDTIDFIWVTPGITIVLGGYIQL